MNPLRLLILGILVYVLIRLIKGGMKGGRKAADRKGGGGQTLPRDVLVQDPVCGTYVPKGQAVRLKKEGKELFFCSEKCRDAYSSEKGDTT